MTRRAKDKATARLDMRISPSRKERYQAHAGEAGITAWFIELAEAEIDRRQWRAWKKRQKEDPNAAREILMEDIYPTMRHKCPRPGLYCPVCGDIVKG